MTSRLLPWAIIAAMGFCGFWLVHRAWDAESKADGLAERQRLTDAGQIAALDRTAKDMQKDKDALTKAMGANLSTALDAALKAAPGAKVTRTMHASTGQVPIDPDALRGLCASQQPDSTPSALQSETPEPMTGEIIVGTIDLEAAKGTGVVVGSAECWRATPEPRLKLFDGKFEARLTQVTQLTPPPVQSLSLGIGPAAFVDREGAVFGLALGAPPLRVWSLQIDAVLAAGIGGGRWQGMATAVGRVWQ
jgi:hypothetical protein